MSRPRVVILRPLGLGDFLAAVPAIRGIARAYGGHERVLAAPLRLRRLVALAGGIDRVVDARPLHPLAEACAEPDVAVDLHGRGPASHRILLSTRPRRLIAFANPDVPGTEAFPRWREDEHEVHRWCRLLTDSGVPADPNDLDIDRPTRPVPALARGSTVIHPGAAYPARRWPPDRWAAVARALGPRVVITGAAGERALAMTIARAAGIEPDRVLAGQTDLVDLAAIVAAAGLVICGDTGIAHLATALRTPSVVLFGPTSPAHWGPPPDHLGHRVIWKGGSGDPHGASPDPGLLQIGVDEVLGEVWSLAQSPLTAGAR